MNTLPSTTSIIPSEDISALHEIINTISEEKEKLKNENKELRIQLSIHASEMELVEIRRNIIIKEISLLQSLEDIESLKTKYEKN